VFPFTSQFLAVFASAQCWSVKVYDWLMGDESLEARASYPRSCVYTQYSRHRRAAESGLWRSTDNSGDLTTLALYSTLTDNFSFSSQQE